MPRRNNPFVTFLMFLAVCALGYAAYHFVVVEKVFEKKAVDKPPDEEIDRITAVLQEGLAADDCFDGELRIGWRPNSQRFRVVVEVRDGCGKEAAQRLGARAQQLVDRATDGKHEAEVAIMLLGQQLYLSLP
jgi:hypothetical protein